MDYININFPILHRVLWCSFALISLIMNIALEDTFLFEQRCRGRRGGFRSEERKISAFVALDLIQKFDVHVL